MDKKISTRGCNYRTFYDYLYNTFPDYCGSQYFNLPPITIENIPHPHKRARYFPNLLPATISVASENIVVLWPTLLIRHNSLSYLLMILTLPIKWGKIILSVASLIEDTALGNIIKKDATNRQGSIAPRALIKIKKLYYFHGFPVLT